MRRRGRELVEENRGLWREKKREEKKVGERRGEGEKVWKKKCLECEWRKYKEKERMNGRM